MSLPELTDAMAEWVAMAETTGMQDATLAFEYEFDLNLSTATYLYDLACDLMEIEQ